MQSKALLSFATFAATANALVLSERAVPVVGFAGANCTGDIIASSDAPLGYCFFFVHGYVEYGVVDPPETPRFQGAVVADFVELVSLSACFLFLSAV